MTDSREYILNRISEALQHPAPAQEAPDLHSSLYPAFSADLTEHFVERFTTTQAQLFRCANQADLLAQLENLIADRGWSQVYAWEANLLQYLQGLPFSLQTSDEGFHEAEAGITFCEALVARTGSLLVSSAQGSGRRLGIYPPVHVVIAFTGQMEAEIKDALALMRKRYPQNLPSMINLVTGPSRTADIEKTLVLGAHGPKELILFLVDDLAV